jgi:hypothetical protein
MTTLAIIGMCALSSVSTRVLMNPVLIGPIHARDRTSVRTDGAARIAVLLSPDSSRVRVSV